jgi:hypothetical protein
MNNIVPRLELSRRQRQWIVVGMVIAVFGGFVGMIWLAMTVIPLVVEANPGYGAFIFARGLALFVAIVALVVGVVVVVRGVTWRGENEQAKMIGRAIAPNLDERYTFIRNVNKFGLGYIDAVLLGPPGVLVFRVLSDEGSFLNEGSSWAKKNRNGEYMPLSYNPTTQCLTDVRSLAEFYERRGILNPAQIVFGVVVFTHDPSRVELRVQQPEVPVAHINTVLNTLATTYFAQERLDARAVKRLVDLLHEE